jgi:hypothetical protein
MIFLSTFLTGTTVLAWKTGSMGETEEGPWNRNEREGIYSIGSNSWFMSIAGPERCDEQPLVIVEAGMGDGHTLLVEGLPKAGGQIPPNLPVRAFWFTDN